MVDVYQAIHARRTVRDFVEKVIDKDTIIKIINAGLLAPTNDHMRQWNLSLSATKRNGSR